MKFIFTLLIIFVTVSILQAQKVWQNQIDGKRPSQIAVDNSGNVIVAGTIDYGVSSQSLTDMYVAKISATGDSLWVRSINGTIPNAQDDALCVGVDNTGNIFVGGYIQDSGDWWKLDYLLVKFDPAGNELWRRVYKGSDNHLDKIQSLIVDQTGDVYVSGFSTETINGGTNQNVTTLKYAANGDSLWMHSWDSPISSTEYFKSMSLNSNNELIVAGQTVITSFPFTVNAPFILKYDTNGNVLFDSLYTTDGLDNELLDAEIDAMGNIYLLTIHVQTFMDGKIELTKYNPNGQQVIQTHFMADSAWNFNNDFPAPLEVNDQGEITIGMYAQTVISWPWVSERMVARFDVTGALLWYDRQIATSFGDDPLLFVKHDGMGHTYTAKQKRIEVSPFVYVDNLVIDKYDNAGNIIWTIWDDTLHNGSGGSNTQVVDLIPDASGNIYVTYAVRQPQTGNKDYLRTIKYDTNIPVSTNEDMAKLPGEFELRQNYPNPFNPTTTIAYTLPENQYVTIRVYNLLGELQAELVNGQKKAGKHIINFNGSHLASGIYLYQLKTESFIQHRKMMLVK